MVAVSPSLPGRRLPAQTMTLALSGLLIAAAILSLTSGAAGLGPDDLVAAVWSDGLSARDRVILFDIRLPRLGLGMAVGAALAVSGVLLQGLFRNPLADPGIVGVSPGAGLGAVLAIVLGGLLPTALVAGVGPALVPLAAGLGGWERRFFSTGSRLRASEPMSRLCSLPASPSRHWPGRERAC